MTADAAVGRVPDDGASLEHGGEDVVELEPIEERLAELEQRRLRK